MKDVILLTIDCWRHDAPAKMPQFRSLVSDFEQGEAICQAAATNGVFPTVLASEYFYNAYNAPKFNTVTDSVTPLQEVFSQAGYETGAFIASNPFLGKWADSFDEFWNDGMVSHTEKQNRSQYTEFDRFWNFLRLQSRVQATDIGERARRWFQNATSPRFLWMHLMDTHGPYYPGLRRGFSVGLLRTYQSILQFSRQRMDASTPIVENIKNLYWECVKLLDKQIDDVLSFLPDDATVIIMADHGEELHNGYIGHARLYDECVRVPFFVNDDDIKLGGAPIRQLDVAPTITERFDLDAPDDWRGTPHDGTVRDCIQVNHSTISDKEIVYLAHRSANTKLIESYNADGQEEDSEFYDLRTDPQETQPIVDEDHSGRQAAEERLMEFKESEKVVDQILASQQTASDVVQQRLEELGYR